MMSTIIMILVALMTLSSIIGTIIIVKNNLKSSTKESLKRFFFLLLLDSISYWGLISSNHYSVDSFNLYYDMSPYWHMQLGRYFNCGTILWALKFGVNQVVAQRVFMAIWVLTITIAIYIIGEVFCELLNCKGKRSYVISAIISLSFINVFAMELMLFPEMAMVFMFSNLAIGILIYLAVSDMNNILKWVLFIWFTFVALGSYQSYIGIIETYVLVALFIKYNDEIKERYTNSASALVLGGFVSVANVLIVKVMISMNLIADSGRGASLTLSNILNNLVDVIQYQFSFWKNADGILPNGIMPLILILIIVGFGYYVYKLSSMEKRIYIFVIVLGCYVLAFAPHIIEKTLTLRPRSNIAVWSVISVLLILSYLNIQKINLKNIFSTIVAVFLLTNIFVMQDMIQNEASNNAIDITEAKLIAEYIFEYEKSTGNYVINIATCQDTEETYYLSSTRYHNGELGGRILDTNYSNYRLIGYELDGRNINLVEMDQKIYQEHFAGKNWDSLNLEEQLVFVGDTLYLAIY